MLGSRMSPLSGRTVFPASPPHQLQSIQCLELRIRSFFHGRFLCYFLVLLWVRLRGRAVSRTALNRNSPLCRLQEASLARIHGVQQPRDLRWRQAGARLPTARRLVARLLPLDACLGRGSGRKYGLLVSAAEIAASKYVCESPVRLTLPVADLSGSATARFHRVPSAQRLANHASTWTPAKRAMPSLEGS